MLTIIFENFLHIMLSSLIICITFMVPALSTQEVLKDIQIRIYGGDDTSGQFPFAVLLVPKHRKQQFLCGGCVISDHHVLTAAHCLKSSVKHFYKPSDIVLLMGANDVSETNQLTGSVISHKVKQFHIHPEFHSPSTSNDIAIVETDERMTFSQTTAPICLGLPGMDEPGVLTTVLGWGKTEDNKNSLVLQKVEIPIQFPRMCENKFHKSFTEKTMLCAGYVEGGKDACQGDSGGPMIVEESGRFVLVGVVSFGDGCAKPHSFAVYTKVSHYREWIVETAPTACLIE